MPETKTPDPSNLVVTSAELKLAPGYKPGEDGNPSVEELQAALRNELKDLSIPDFTITISKSGQ